MSDTKVITGKVRLSYANIFVPTASDETKPDEKKYNTSVLIPKSDKKTIDAINKAVEACCEAFKTKNGGKLPKNYKLPLRDGDEEKEDDPNYVDHYFLNCSSKRKPGVIDRQGNEITDLDRDEIYSGVYARLSINFYNFEAPGGTSKGVAVGLNNVQKLADGEVLGGAFSTPEDDFADAFEDDDDFGL